MSQINCKMLQNIKITQNSPKGKPQASKVAVSVPNSTIDNSRPSVCTCILSYTVRWPALFFPSVPSRPDGGLDKTGWILNGFIVIFTISLLRLRTRGHRAHEGINSGFPIRTRLLHLLFNVHAAFSRLYTNDDNAKATRKAKRRATASSSVGYM